MVKSNFEEWIQKSITPSETNPEYGYMWWINSELGEDYQTTDWKNVPTNIFTEVVLEETK